jgi:hypothetical protein
LFTRHGLVVCRDITVDIAAVYHCQKQPPLLLLHPAPQRPRPLDQPGGLVVVYPVGGCLYLPSFNFLIVSFKWTLAQIT